MVRVEPKIRKAAPGLSKSSLEVGFVKGKLYSRVIRFSGAQSLVVSRKNLSFVSINISFPICRTIEALEIKSFSWVAHEVVLACFALDYSLACPAF